MTRKYPIKLHYFRNSTEGESVSTFLVTIPDSSLVGLNQGHAMRGLTIAFNGLGRPSSRLRALADALKEAEDAFDPIGNPVADAGLSRRFARWITKIVYNNTRFARKEKV